MITSGTVKGLEVTSKLPLNDDNWHTVYVDITNQEICLTLDRKYSDKLTSRVVFLPKLNDVWKLGELY